MKAILNKTGLQIFSKFLPKLKAINPEPIFVVKQSGMLIYGLEPISKQIKYSFDLLPEAFAEEFELESEVEFKPNLEQMSKIFKKVGKFDEATLSFKGTVNIELESKKGIKMVTSLPTMLIEKDDRFNRKGYSEILEREGSCSFRIEAGAIKDVFDISKAFTSKQDESVLIEKSEDTIRITTKHDATISTSVLEMCEEGYLQDLEGSDGVIKIPYKPLEIAFGCCDLDAPIDVAFIDETLICIRQLTNTYIFEVLIQGSLIEEESE